MSSNVVTVPVVHEERSYQRWSWVGKSLATWSGFENLEKGKSQAYAQNLKLTNKTINQGLMVTTMMASSD